MNEKHTLEENAKQQNINMKKILELSIIVNLCFITGIIVNYIPKINMNIYLFILINFFF